jgi:hypothetical protein
VDVPGIVGIGDTGTADPAVVGTIAGTDVDGGVVVAGSDVEGIVGDAVEGIVEVAATAGVADGVRERVAMLTTINRPMISTPAPPMPRATFQTMGSTSLPWAGFIGSEEPPRGEPGNCANGS